VIRVAFAGAFARSLAARVRAHVPVPCDVTLADEADLAGTLPAIDVRRCWRSGATWRARPPTASTCSAASSGSTRCSGTPMTSCSRSRRPRPRGLVDAARLAAMKPTAMRVNVARAELVDAAALYRALAERRIAAAALDVWYRYPTEAAPMLPAHQPFHALPNVLLTPHVSGWTAGMESS
jgi:hypothetical protein